MSTCVSVGLVQSSGVRILCLSKSDMSTCVSVGLVQSSGVRILCLSKSDMSTCVSVRVTCLPVFQ
jgi:hypothetical protein